MPLDVAFNRAEAVVWFVFAALCLGKALRSATNVRRPLLVLVVAFVAFGISDLIESRTGAWWRPWWLLVLKGASLAAIVLGFLSYRRANTKR